MIQQNVHTIVHGLISELGAAQSWQEILNIGQAIYNVRRCAQMEIDALQARRVATPPPPPLMQTPSMPIQGYGPNLGSLVSQQPAYQPAPNFQQQAQAARQMMREDAGANIRLPQVPGESVAQAFENMVEGGGEDFGG